MHRLHRFGDDMVKPHLHIYIDSPAARKQTHPIWMQVHPPFQSQPLYRLSQCGISPTGTACRILSISRTEKYPKMIQPLERMLWWRTVFLMLTSHRTLTESGWTLIPAMDFCMTLRFGCEVNVWTWRRYTVHASDTRRRKCMSRQQMSWNCQGAKSFRVINHTNTHAESLTATRMRPCKPANKTF